MSIAGHYYLNSEQWHCIWSSGLLHAIWLCHRVLCWTSFNSALIHKCLLQVQKYSKWYNKTNIDCWSRQWNTGNPSANTFPSGLKKCVSIRVIVYIKLYIIIVNFGLHHYQPTQWLLTHSTHLSVCFVCCFYLLFQLHIICYPALGPQGWLLLNWLID